MAITQPKVIQPERNSSLNCNTSRYSHIPNIKSIYKGRRQKKVQKTYILMWRTDRRTEPKTIVPFCFRRYGTNKLPCICSMYDIDITVFSMNISYLASVQCLYWYHSVFHENKLPCICSMYDIDITVFSMNISYLAPVQCMIYVSYYLPWKYFIW